MNAHSQRGLTFTLWQIDGFHHSSGQPCEWIKSVSNDTAGTTVDRESTAEESPTSITESDYCHATGTFFLKKVWPFSSYWKVRFWIGCFLWLNFVFIFMFFPTLAWFLCCWSKIPVMGSLQGVNHSGKRGRTEDRVNDWYWLMSVFFILPNFTI